MKREYLNVMEWEGLHRDVTNLSDQIVSDGFDFDLMIGIGYGGIVPSTLLYFALPEIDFTIVYPTSSSTEGLGALPPLEGRKVLLVDDLAITGDSLTEIRKGLREMGPTKLETAVLYRSADYADVEFCVRTLDAEERIVFPWYYRPGDGATHVMKYKNRFGKHEPVD